MRFIGTTNMTETTLDNLTIDQWRTRALDAEKRLQDIDAEPAGSHHGDPILTKRDISLLEAYSVWIQTFAKAQGVVPFLTGYPDWIKSRLFWRIRSGKKPLPYPPPTAFSCPWYELIEVPEPHETADTVREYDGKLIVAQSRYEILGREDNKWIVGYGPYRFKAWNGPITRQRYEDSPNGKIIVEFQDVCGWIEYIGLDTEKDGK